jgi:hypothetical protein
VSDLHSVREGGAVGVHAFQDSVTAQIVDIEPEEAEHLLSVIEALFTVCFVEPGKAKEKRRSIREKYKKA